MQYVKSNLVNGSVGVHGVSLGGSIASFIASKIKVDFIFIDRTFASLQHVAYWSAGRALLIIFNILTCGGWKDNGLENFKNILTGTYTVFSCDSNDRVITEMASLKTAVARDLVKSQFAIRGS